MSFYLPSTTVESGYFIQGIPERKLVESNKNLVREDNGLERIKQDYLLRTQDLEFFASNVFINGKSYYDVYQYSAAYNPANYIATPIAVEAPVSGYECMRIERVDYESQKGGITVAKITYVGLFSTAYPKPIISYDPIIDNNWMHHNYEINITFVSFVGSEGSNYEKLILQDRFSIQNKFLSVYYYLAPSLINGYRFYFNKVFPYTWVGYTGVRPNANLAWANKTGCYLLCIPTGGSEVQHEGKGTFLGFTQTSLTFKRYGLVGLFQMKLKDAAYLQGYYSQTSGGANPEIVCLGCFGVLNLVK